MNLINSFLEYAARSHFGAQPEVLSITDGPWTIACRLSDSSPHACSLLDFRMQPFSGKDWDGSKVRRCAEAIATRVDFLLERLASIETDLVSGCALIRSSAPSVRGERKEYYELTLDRDGSIGVERRQSIAGNHGSRQIPLILTHEFLEKLVGTLQEIIGSEFE